MRQDFSHYEVFICIANRKSDVIFITGSGGRECDCKWLVQVTNRKIRKLELFDVEDFRLIASYFDQPGHRNI